MVGLSARAPLIRAFTPHLDTPYCHQRLARQSASRFFLEKDTNPTMEEKKGPYESFEQFLEDQRVRVRVDDPPILTISKHHKEVKPDCQWCVTIFQVDKNEQAIDRPVMHIPLQRGVSFDPLDDPDATLQDIFGEVHFYLLGVWNEGRSRPYGFKYWLARAREDGLEQKYGLEQIYEREKSWVLRAHAFLSRTAWRAFCNLEQW